ncbi:hypothetical protein JOF53_000743 [Crossiella equi]|uniref:N-acetyltransferase domain-containing protein n=1 Tax=Crossiella equi TaxID=130796 RepID=A0ABS5A5K4_9PSEU|nr:hypothetical protein [Crossiella equi]MBP2471871.1 hypothetical protein [Crossiella equi]
MTAPYLAAAREAGLLHHLRGHAYVLGEFHDALSGTTFPFVEHAEDGLLADPALLEELPPGPVLLRTEGERVPDGPWTRWLTYLRLPAEPARPETDLVCAPARAEEEPLVAEWLWQAFLAGAPEAAPDAVAGVVAAVLAAPGRHTLVARREGRAIGHATLLPGGHDDVTGESFVELVDSLVEAEQDRRVATELFVHAAWRLARELGEPLVGNVVHHSGGQRVLDSLCRRGWRVWHSYWTSTPSGVSQVSRSTPPAVSA